MRNVIKYLPLLEPLVSLGLSALLLKKDKSLTKQEAQVAADVALARVLRMGGRL